MKSFGFATAVVGGLLVLCACAPARRMGADGGERWHPWTNQVTTAQDLAAAIQARWTLARIRAYCASTAPTSRGIQNLVALGEAWHGNLHENEASEFDRLWWYASTRSGKLDKYSVNATKGRKHWIIEIGNERSLADPPALSGGDKAGRSRADIGSD